MLLSFSSPVFSVYFAVFYWILAIYSYLCIVYCYFEFCFLNLYLSNDFFCSFIIFIILHLIVMKPVTTHLLGCEPNKRVV